MPQCPACGQTVEATDAFCRHCGAALGKRAPASRRTFMGQMAADYEDRLKSKPDDPDALYNLGLSRLYAGQAREAAECFGRVIELVPEFAAAHGKLAVCLWQLGDAKAAREAISRAVNLAPQDRRLADLQARMAET